LKYALRRLALTPGFTLATLLTQALGIGANTAIFSIINSVLLRPLPFHAPDRLIGILANGPVNHKRQQYLIYPNHYSPIRLFWMDSSGGEIVTVYTG
jgi:hypothetical protein